MENYELNKIIRRAKCDMQSAIIALWDAYSESTGYTLDAETLANMVHEDVNEAFEYVKNL